MRILLLTALLSYLSHGEGQTILQNDPKARNLMLKIGVYGSNNANYNVAGEMEWVGKLSGNVRFDLGYKDIARAYFGATDDPFITHFYQLGEAGIMLALKDRTVKRSITFLTYFNTWTSGDYKYTASRYETVSGIKTRHLSGIRVGFQSYRSSFLKNFQAVNTKTTAGGSPDPNDTATALRFYQTKYVATNLNYGIIYFGYGWKIIKYCKVDFGDLVKKRKIVKNIYLDAFYAPYSMLQYTNGNADGSSLGTYVSEPIYKTSFGGRFGMSWSSTKHLGWWAALEMGMRPGVFHREGDYGPGTNDGALQNFYFSSRFGWSSGWKLGKKSTAYDEE